MGEHYFSADPAADLHTREVRVRAWGNELGLLTASGVFSSGRVDLGTRVLFRETQPPIAAGTLIDVGCGYGVIACALAVAVPKATVWAVDVNRRALQLARANADRLGIADRLVVGFPDDVPADLLVDELWSNPPIRIGKPALHDLLLSWLPHLTSDGIATFVVGKNLGADSLQRWLGVQGYPTTRLASAKGFRVLRSTRSADG